jgi:hypothetical protein
MTQMSPGPEQGAVGAAKRGSPGWS